MITSFSDAKASNKTVVDISVKSTWSTVTTTHTKFRDTTQSIHKDVLIYCIENSIRVGDVVTISVGANRGAAKDCYYSIINILEAKFIVESDFIRGSYLAIIKGAKLKVA